MKQLKINPKGEELTIEKLRELTGKPELSEEEADKIIGAIDLFARTLYRFVKEKRTHCIDNQIVVNLINHSEPLNNAA